MLCVRDVCVLMEEIEVWVVFFWRRFHHRVWRGQDHRAALENGSYLNSYSVCGLLTISLIIIPNSEMFICILLRWLDLSSGRLLINLDAQSKSITVKSAQTAAATVFAVSVSKYTRWLFFPSPPPTA